VTSGFRGAYTVCVTPFSRDGSRIDTDALRQFLSWQLEVGVPGVIVLGTTGEFLTVSDDERAELVSTAVQHMAGRATVLVGTMNTYTPRAVAYSRQAQELGADGLMVLPPYYYTPTDDEIFRYYGAISGAVDLPIMLYNNPVTSNVDMSAALVARLAQAYGNIRYIKESSQDLARVRDVIEATDGSVQVYAGERPVESYLLGAVGWVNPYGNYIPRASNRMWQLLEEGRLEDARRVQRLVDAMDHIIAAGHPTYGHQCYSKRLAALAGYPMGDVRPPLTRFADLSEEGDRRVSLLADLMSQLDRVVDEIDAKSPVP
jgi:4-hydroxy-tetrahydrodipicolinate synthase